MRRIVLTITALLVLVGASVAYAATLNSYTGSTLSFPKTAGSAKKPKPIAFKQELKAASTDSSKAAAVLTDIKAKAYGLRSNGKSFPTCSLAKIQQQKSDTFCPNKSKFATGSVNALLGDPTLNASSRSPCNPALDVFNAGQGKLTFFFTTSATHVCLGLQTGATGPWTATLKQQGKNLVLDVPLPPAVSTAVANQPNLYGSLTHLVLNWRKLTTKVKGKTVGAIEAVGCKKGQRPWSLTLTASRPSTETQTLSGSSKC